MCNFFKKAKPKNKNEISSNKNKKKTYRKILRFIEILSALATVAASIATCLTVTEMKNERNQLYKPQMIFESSNFSDDYEGNTWNIRDIRNLIVLKNDEEQFPKLETTIYNIGSDAALDIKIEFILDNYADYVREITQYYDENEFEINDNSFDIKYDETTFSYSISDKDFIINKPYLLSGESFKINIPEEFCQLLYCLNCCTNRDYSWQPTIHLKMSYLDLQGNEYTYDYELIVNTEMTPSDEYNQYWHVDYNIIQGSYKQ